MSPAIRFSVLRPKPVKSKAMLRVINKGLEEEAKKILDDYQRTVRTWNRKPKFYAKTNVRPRSVEVILGTDDQIWHYVDKGTKRHPILPRRKKWLRFRSGYTHKTRVGIIGSWPGGPHGDVVFSGGVMHPGFPARGFSKAMSKHMGVAARVSGHWIPRAHRKVTW